MAESPWDSLEAAFKDLDSKEFGFFADALGAYLKALMKAGFTREEAMKLVESYSRFIYDMSIEEFWATKKDDIDEF